MLYKAASETDQSGKLVRPYLNERHPDYQIASKIAESVVNYNPNVTANELIDVLDTRMGTKKQRRPDAPKVMSGRGLTSQAINAKGKIRLTNAQVQEARKLGLDPASYAKTLSVLERSGKSVSIEDL